jgi:hypothetical protein
MSYIPPHLRGKKIVAPVIATRHIRFIGNALGNTNEEPNKGVRFEPHTGELSKKKKKTLKTVRLLTPDAVPKKPGYTLRNAAPKFAKMVRNHLGLSAWKKTRKVKKAKKAKRPKNKKRGTRKL